MIGMVEIELSEGLKDKIAIVIKNGNDFERKSMNWEIHKHYRKSFITVKNQPYGINKIGMKNDKHYLLRDIMTMAKTGGKIMLSPEGVRIINEVQALPNNEVYGMEY